VYPSGISQAKVILFSFSSIAKRVLTTLVFEPGSFILRGNSNQELGKSLAIFQR